MKKSLKWLAVVLAITLVTSGSLTNRVIANSSNGNPSNSAVGLSAYTDVVDFGASPDKSHEENKQALQDAIAHVDAQGGGVIIVPVTVEYGYKRNDVSTHPDFTNTDSNIHVIDYSIGVTEASNPLARVGMQVRNFSSTEGDETNGQHDGNTFWFMGKWHPALMIMHNDETANNRRASIFFGNRGTVTWGIGQGTNTINGGTDDQLSDFKIAGNKVAGSPSLTTMFTIKKISGFFGWNVGSPSKEFHFVGRQANTDFLIQQGKAGGDVNLIMKTKSHTRTFNLEEDNGDLIITKSDGTSPAVRISANGNASFENGVSGGAFNSSNLPAAASVKVGTMIFHTELNKPLWSNGTNWVDAAGNSI
jgi:hypothetical protein